MNKIIIGIIGWILVFLALIYVPRLVDKIQPQIVEKEIPYYVIKEKIVEKPIFKGEKIIEKIVYKETPIELFSFELIKRIKVDNDDIERLYGMTFNKKWNFVLRKSYDGDLKITATKK